MPAFLLALALWSGAPPEEANLSAILDRVSEEAEAFLNLAPRIIGTETWHQRVQKPARRLRLRVGKSALERPAARIEERRIVCEYGFGQFKDSPGTLHELRTVVSVDGRPVAAQAEARQSLALGITSDDDRHKRRILSRFQRYGLAAAAVDFGQLVLMFTRRQLASYEFESLGERRLGPHAALALTYRQRQGEAAFTIFEGNRAHRMPLGGELWVRRGDLLPLRISLRGAFHDGKHQIEHRASVEYFPSAYGLVLPASVHYQKLADGEVIVEHLATYSNFRMFKADTEIRFESAPVEAAR